VTWSHGLRTQNVFALFLTQFFFFCLGPRPSQLLGLSDIFEIWNDQEALASLLAAMVAKWQFGLLGPKYKFFGRCIDLEFLRSVPWQFGIQPVDWGQFWDESAHSWGYSLCLILIFSACSQYRNGQPLEKSNNISIWIARIWGLVRKFLTSQNHDQRPGVYWGAPSRVLMNPPCRPHACEVITHPSPSTVPKMVFKTPRGCFVEDSNI